LARVARQYFGASSKYSRHEAMDLQAIARDLATANPGGILPCPNCGASVKGANLVDHLARVHAAEPSTVATKWRGTDDGTLRTWLALAIFVSASATALVLARLPLILYVVASIGVVIGVIAVFRLARKPVELELLGDDLILRRSLGFRRRIAHPPWTLEVGPLVGARSALGATDVGNPQDDPRTGTYLRFEGPQPITIGCRSSAALRKHWTGWRQGAQRRGADITLSRQDVLALQYVLALRGALTVAT
jgi:hypothetical protein